MIREKAGIRDITLDARSAGKVVGLVPTMGYFHEGHLELMRRAAAECDVVVVSLFVNPTQFGPGEDFEAYPRDLERDSSMAASVGVDYIFCPDSREMYPDGHDTLVEVEGLSGVMCGACRPGHFRGVATVVAKLFNIVPAQRAYFGRKDAQQLAVIRRMVADLDFDVRVVGVETVREPDGLAMSSRNIYLDAADRVRARALSRSLSRAGEMIKSGERDAAAIDSAVRETLSAEGGIDIEYVAICDNIYLQPLSELRGEVLVAVAARIGKARLIDNMIFDVE